MVAPPAPRVGHRPCQSGVNDLVNFPVYRVKDPGNSQTQLIAKPAARVEYQNDALTKLTEQVDHRNEAIDQLVPVELAVNEPVKSAALSYVSEPGAASVTGVPYSTQTPVPNTPPTFSRRRVVVKIRGFGENSAAARFRFLSARSSGHTNKAGSSSLRCEEPYLPQRGLSAL